MEFIGLTRVLWRIPAGECLIAGQRPLMMSKATLKRHQVFNATRVSSIETSLTMMKKKTTFASLRSTNRVYPMLTFTQPGDKAQRSRLPQAKRNLCIRDRRSCARLGRLRKSPLKRESRVLRITRSLRPSRESSDLNRMVYYIPSLQRIRLLWKKAFAGIWRKMRKSSLMKVRWVHIQVSFLRKHAVRFNQSQSFMRSKFRNSRKISELISLLKIRWEFILKTWQTKPKTTKLSWQNYLLSMKKKSTS